MFISKSFHSLSTLDSWYQFSKYLKAATPPLYRFDYCNGCGFLFHLEDYFCHTCSILRLCEENTAVDKRMKNFFVMFNLQDIITRKFSSPKFISLLKSNISKIQQAKNSSTYYNIYCGDIYQKYVAQNKLGKLNQIFVCINLDGISPYGNSSITI